LNTKGLSKNQKEILEILVAHPNSTQIEIAKSVFNKEVSPKSSESSSVGRSLHSLERRGLVEKSDRQVTWRIIKPK